MPRPPTAKKAKPPKPDFVFPPGGAAIAAVPGLRLKPGTGDVPRWWPVDKPGRAPFACNVEGVSWATPRIKWHVSHIDATTNKLKYVGVFATFADACSARVALVDGKTTKGVLKVVGRELCVSHCVHPTCRRTNIPATEFAPDVFKFKKKFSEYDNLLATIVHGLTEDTCAVIDKTRVTECVPCRYRHSMSRKQGEYSETAKCRRVIDEEIKPQWAAKGGCQNCGCCDIDVLSGDHKDRRGKDAHEQCLSPSWWAVNGGADALREHYLGPNSPVRCLCHFCHALEKSHNLHKGTDLDNLIDGSSAKYKRKYILEKRAHVNADKLRRGRCEHPRCCDQRTGQARVVTPEIYHAFHYAHKNEVEKRFSISKMVANRSCPATCIPKLDKEMRKCLVYCANCHHKYDTLPRLKEGRELLDALLARGAPVCEECE